MEKIFKYFKKLETNKKLTHQNTKKKKLGKIILQPGSRNDLYNYDSKSRSHRKRDLQVQLNKAKFLHGKTKQKNQTKPNQNKNNLENQKIKNKLGKKEIYIGITVKGLYFFFFFFGPHLWHMEVPGLGIKSKPHSYLYHSCGNAGSLTCCATVETPLFL